jgi:lysophospholipase L1-like esterase
MLITNIVFGILYGSSAIALTYYLFPLFTNWQKEMALIHSSQFPMLKTVGLVFIVMIILILVSMAILSIVKRRKKSILAMNIIALITVILFFVTFEFIGRISIRKNIRPFNIPSLYANGFCSDNYWKILLLQETEPLPDHIYHEILGWTTPRSLQNPDGLVGNYQSDDRPKILFYGDSFMEGVSSSDSSIPAYAQTLQDKYQTLNYGVSSYGVDQIFLRYQLTAQPYQQPIVFFGILLEDIDRCILTIRSSVKPYFKKISSDPLKFELAGTPIPRNRIEWVKNHPPELGSYTFSFFKQMISMIKNQFDGFNDPALKKEKIELNRYIIQQAFLFAENHNHLLIPIIFTNRRLFFEKENWHYTFLLELFSQMNKPYIDTYILFKTKTAGNTAEINKLFIEGDDHYNARGNQLIAKAIIDYLHSVKRLP